MQLEVALPSLRGQRSGACLRTHGHVVRSEELGFAAAADMGFRMQFPEGRTQRSSGKAGIDENGNGSASGADEGGMQLDLASRFCM